jgi:hypothetical protein
MNASAVASAGKILSLHKGKFTAGSTEQFLIAGEKGWLAGSCDPVTQPCTGEKPLQTTLRPVRGTGDAAALVCTGDFNGDGRSEILETLAGGRWQLLSAGPTGEWKMMAESGNEPVSEWDPAVAQTGIRAGKFLPGYPNDVLLTISKPKTGRQYTWSLKRLQGGKWISFAPPALNFCGRTIGIDTLKPADQFIFLVRPGQRTLILRYNRDWRFDLKEIVFSDTAFAIRANVDFSGYEKDHNPKYYETLILTPGRFEGTEAAQLFAAGKVAKERNYRSSLPDFTALYSFSTGVNK